MAFESCNVKAIGKLCEGKLHAQFDEGVLETGRWKDLNGHKTGNSGHSQDQSCTLPRQCSTLRLIHCKTQQQATELLDELKARFAECGLELHPDKTKIVYCKDGKRKENYPNKSFDFLGYTFRARMCRNTKDNSRFLGFTPAVSKQSMNSMRSTIRKHNVRNRTDLSLIDIAKGYNPILQGWLNYYGEYTKSAMYAVWRHFNKTLVAWAMRKYKPFQKNKAKAALFLINIAKEQPYLFAHWKVGMIGAFT